MPEGNGSKRDLTHGAVAQGAHGIIGLSNRRARRARCCPLTGTPGSQNVLVSSAQVKVCLFACHSGQMSGTGVKGED
ncbi:hypothetical protein GCM10010390_33790 [Streptomyces mordarskii]|uniref:Uncharacterized protein n=1 Tax=Streptomyces mordarskii TaxID=1226758 RepID=A0ABN1CZ66_9ACTN